jgi:hypothetical protein
MPICNRLVDLSFCSAYYGGEELPRITFSHSWFKHYNIKNNDFSFLTWSQSYIFSLAIVWKCLGISVRLFYVLGYNLIDRDSSPDMDKYFSDRQCVHTVSVANPLPVPCVTVRLSRKYSGQSDDNHSPTHRFKVWRSCGRITLNQGHSKHKCSPPQKKIIFVPLSLPSPQLYIYLWLYSLLLVLGRFFNFLMFYTVGRTPWTEDQPVSRPLPAHRATHTQQSVPWVGFEPTIPVFERAKAVHALNRPATVSGLRHN